MHEAVDKRMDEKTKANLSTTSNNLITLGCGTIDVCVDAAASLPKILTDIYQGFAAAILSQPADTLLSQINKGKGGPGGVLSRLGQLAKEAGPVGLFSGLGPRMVMTAGYAHRLCRCPSSC